MIRRNALPMVACTLPSSFVMNSQMSQFYHSTTPPFELHDFLCKVVGAYYAYFVLHVLMCILFIYSSLYFI